MCNSLDAISLTGDNGQVTYSPYFTILAVPAGTATNYTASAPAAVSGSAPAASGSSGSATPAASGTANSTASGTASAGKTSESSAATSLKAGLFGAAGIAGAVALLL